MSCKYITTDKHPELKEGVLIEPEEIENAAGIDYTGAHKTKLDWFRFDEYDLKELLKKGYIKEVQEPEFTKDDMIDFASWTLQAYNDGCDPEHLENWLKQKK